ncbi:MAG: hypothetical protein ACXW1D_00020 [Halobacteriota archaeon]
MKEGSTKSLLQLIIRKHMSDDLISMMLTPSEVQVVLKERQRVLDAQALAYKKANCLHDWTYRGEWRGSSGYICYKCDENKWE